MFQGTLTGICIAPGAKIAMESREQIEAITGRGLAGDCYAEGQGAFQRGEIEPKQQVTLIEQEALDAVAADYELEISHAETRRNLLTSCVPLNHLVGREFFVGSVRLRGIELCEPCSYLEKLTFPGIEKALRHRGGLRAEVLDGGTIRIGDAIRPAD